MGVPARATAFALVCLPLACSSDDSGDGGSDDGTGSETGLSDDGEAGDDMTSGGTGDGSGDGMDDGSGDGMDDGSGDDGSSSASGDDGTDTGGVDDRVELKNDSWEMSGGIIWQAWPGPGDCIASVYDIDPGLYPFDIDAIRVIIGGASGTESFDVGIWDVDGENMPTTEIAKATVDIEGNAASVPEINLADNGIVVPTIESGTFAAVVCQLSHMGEPTFSVDDDGNADRSRNFIYRGFTNEWEPAPGFVAGDFILRAMVDTGG